MKNDLGGHYIVWLAAVCGIFVLLNIDSMWSWSVDLAHHYALAFRISEQWTLTSSSDPTLGEMNIYPRGSHIIAAILGFLVNSTFLGVQIVTLFSLAFLWLSAILILNSLKNTLAVFSIIVFTALFIFNAAFTKLDLHGHEIVENFFYSQLVGHSVLFISVIFAIGLEKKLGTLWSVVTLVVLMLLNATIHLLPALEMLGLVFGLLFVYVFFEARPESNIKQRLAIATAIALCALASIILHPSFAAMRAISENNGGLGLNNVQYPYGLILLCAIVLFSSFKLFQRWIRSEDNSENLAIKYISIYGGVTAALCLLQFTLTFSDLGSDYAVKKYGFGLTSIFLLEVSIVFGRYVSLLMGSNEAKFANKANISNGNILVASLSAVLVFSVPNQKTLDVSDVTATERKLINLGDTILPAPPIEKNNVVIGLDGFPNTVNYMFSISILKTVRELAIPDVLVSNTLTNPSNYLYVVSSRGNPNFGAAGCKSLSSSSLSVIASACLEERRARASDCRFPFDFTSNGIIPNSLLAGFSHPEVHGRWTDGKLAKFKCVNNGAPAKVIKLQITPFIFGALKSQRISVSLNGVVLGVYDLSTPRGADNPILINIPHKIDTKEYSLEFEMPDATAPRDVGFNEDGRKLGFSFKTILFE